jgi:hypothetical protein
MFKIRNCYFGVKTILERGEPPPVFRMALLLNLENEKILMKIKVKAFSCGS